MKKLLILPLLSLILIGCDTDRKAVQETHEKKTHGEVDNSARNVRDREGTLTPIDQSESVEDRTITQQIRRTIISQDNLSTNGKNIKIITIDGVVTLRGVVDSPDEKNTIENHAKEATGVHKVDNQLEVKSSK